MKNTQYTRNTHCSIGSIAFHDELRVETRENCVFPHYGSNAPLECSRDKNMLMFSLQHKNFGRKPIEIREMSTVLLIPQAYTINYMRKIEKIAVFSTATAWRHWNVREEKLLIFPLQHGISGERPLEYLKCPLYY